MLEALKKVKYSLSLIVFLHFCGIIGVLFTPYRELVWSLTPVILSMSYFLFALQINESRFAYHRLSFVIFIIGFVVEIIGVNTGLIFGNYTYGSVLGIKIFGTPIMIGLTWLILVLTIGDLLKKYLTSVWLVAIVGALLMTMFDMILEPVAIKYGFWMWENLIPPLQNYVAWYIISFVLLLIFSKFKTFKENKMSFGLILTLVAFFLILNLK